MITEEKITEIAKALLDRMQRKYDYIEYLDLKKNFVDRDGSVKDVHRVGYDLQTEYQNISNFVFIDAKSEKALFILTKHGYIEIE